MRKSLLEYADEALSIQNAFQYGSIVRCLSLASDCVEKQNAEETVSILTFLAYVYSTCRYEQMVSGKKPDLYLVRDLCRIPFDSLLSLVEDRGLRSYLAVLLSAIQSFCRNEDSEAQDKLESLIEMNGCHEAPHYFLAVLGARRNDLDLFFKHFNELTHQTKEFSLSDKYVYMSGEWEFILEAEDLFLPVLPANMATLLNLAAKEHGQSSFSEKRLGELARLISQESEATRREVQVQATRIISALSQALSDLSAETREERQACIQQFNDQQRIVEDLSEFILEKVQVIEKQLDEQEVTQAQYALECFFGAEIWNHEKLLSDESRTLLITGEAIFDTLNRPSKRNLDFSPAVIPLTKAYENELYRHFYLPLCTFCQETLGSYNARWPEPLIYPNPYMQTRPNAIYKKNQIHFTLGSVIKIIEDANFKRISDAFRDAFFVPGTDLPALAGDVAYIKRHYRDKVAHKEGISFTDAKSCRAEMIEVNKRFNRFLNSIKK